MAIIVSVLADVLYINSGQLSYHFSNILEKLAWGHQYIGVNNSQGLAINNLLPAFALHSWFRTFEEKFKSNQETIHSANHLQSGGSKVATDDTFASLCID